MPPHYNHGQLTKEQQKLVTDNLPYLWFYYKNKVKPKYKHMGDNVLEEVKAEMQFYFCLAAEKYDPEKGKFSSYSTFYLKNAVQLYFHNRAKFTRNNVDVVPFIDDVNVSVKRVGFVVWDRLVDLFKSAGLSREHQNVLKLYYHDRWTMLKIAKKYKITREGIRRRLKKAIGFLHLYIIENDVEMDDLKDFFDIEENRAERKFGKYRLKEPVYP